MDCNNCAFDKNDNIIFCSLECRNKYAAENNFPSFIYRCRNCALLTTTPYGHCESQKCIDYINIESSKNDPKDSDCLLL